MTFSLIKTRPQFHRKVINADTGETECLCGGKHDGTGSKMRNVRTEYEGASYHSGFEASYAQELDWRQRSGEKFTWERQVKISFDVCLECGVLVIKSCKNHPHQRPAHLVNYYMDFLVHYPDGTEEYVEVKGQETDVWKAKWHMLEAVFREEVKEGTVRLLLVKEKSNMNWLKKLKKT
jgi:hypothetical protein